MSLRKIFDSDCSIVEKLEDAYSYLKKYNFQKDKTLYALLECCKRNYHSFIPILEDEERVNLFHFKHEAHTIIEKCFIGGNVDLLYKFQELYDYFKIIPQHILYGIQSRKDRMIEYILEFLKQNPDILQLDNFKIYRYMCGFAKSHHVETLHSIIPYTIPFLDDCLQMALHNENNDNVYFLIRTYNLDIHINNDIILLIATLMNNYSLVEYCLSKDTFDLLKKRDPYLPIPYISVQYGYLDLMILFEKHFTYDELEAFKIANHNRQREMRMYWIDKIIQQGDLQKYIAIWKYFERSFEMHDISRYYAQKHNQQTILDYINTHRKMIVDSVF